MGASERTRGRLADSGGAGPGAPPGAAELHGPAGPAADQGRGGQGHLAAGRRPADRLLARSHREDWGEPIRSILENVTKRNIRMLPVTAAEKQQDV